MVVSGGWLLASVAVRIDGAEVSVVLRVWCDLQLISVLVTLWNSVDLLPDSVQNLACCRCSVKKYFRCRFGLLV